MYPISDLFDIVVQGIIDSRSAFEQYQSLRAASLMISNLSSEQCDTLINILEDQRSGVPDKHIKEHTDRWDLSSKIIERAKYRLK